MVMEQQDREIVAVQVRLVVMVVAAVAALVVLEYLGLIQVFRDKPEAQDLFLLLQDRLFSTLVAAALVGITQYRLVAVAVAVMEVFIMALAVVAVQVHRVLVILVVVAGQMLPHLLVQEVLES